MLKFIGKRLAYAILTLFLIATATFFLVAGAPGDPIAAKVGQMPEQAQEIIEKKYKDRNIIILLDLPGGTPANMALPFLSASRKLVAGINLPFVLD
mgnify:CR=1 FL=1